jgi:hypothetical protein
MTKDAFIMTLVLSAIVILFTLNMFYFVSILKLSRHDDLQICIDELRRSEKVLKHVADYMYDSDSIAHIWQQTAQNCNNKTGK